MPNQAGLSGTGRFTGSSSPHKIATLIADRLRPFRMLLMGKKNMRDFSRALRRARSQEAQDVVLKQDT